MSSRRRVQKISYSDELDDDDDYYGQSYEEEIAVSPSVSRYIYQRQGGPSSNLSDVRVDEFIPEEQNGVETSQGDEFGGDEMFAMDVNEKPSTIPPTSVVPAGFGQASPIGLGLDKSECSSQSAVLERPASKVVKDEKPVTPNIASLRISTPNRTDIKEAAKLTTGLDSALASLPANSSSHRLNQLASIAATPVTPKKTRNREESKQLINLVVAGHVDAGKSTLMGHLLYKLGYVDQRTIHKYKQESARSGKASFAFAWVLDETEEERSRGVTMDVAKTSFETTSKRIVLLDAPGHKDFIPNMITGASQADAAILVINATRGEFETGYENGGQTVEHAMLLRSLGVGQVVVAVNKLDTVDWSEERYKEIISIMELFLSKHAGFSNVRYVPVSGLDGENLTDRIQPSSNHPLANWYTGPCLLELIDTFSAPPRACEGPLRIVISDVLKMTTNLLSLSGKMESGEVEAGDKVYVMPTGDAAVVKACSNDSGGAVDTCIAGDQVLLTLNGTFELDTIHAGHVIVSGGQDVLMPCRRFIARIVVFDIVPIMKGTKAELYCHSLCESCTVVKLISSINKGNGSVIKSRPRFLGRQMSGIVEIETDREVAIETYTTCKALGRITIRARGKTIAAGIVERKLS
ncbi:hypothetical protein KIN20_019146 [Parelaphostrongylus tenuis]|uniref:Tr-type G domain-containing protein n=1 Tax=Parelaphostrongylus tenuis TaxID=148309 RepID=A0AAD5QS42_PARTN|nr:hypothetical protein KIN20_019146 [Parelaphostrongylus tenuis]